MAYARGPTGVVMLSVCMVSGAAGQVVQDASGTPDPNAEGLRVLASVQVGLDPHQIAFSPDGARAYVATAGSDRVTIVDAATYRVRATLPVPGTPLGVAVLDGGSALAVTRFGSDRIVRIGANAGALLGELQAGGGPSLFVGPTPDGRFVVSSEQANRLLVLDGATFQLETSFDVGRRPFPPALTSDGSVALVPSYNEGTVTRVNLSEGRVAWTVTVGARPSGGAVLTGDTLYAVAVRGEDRVVLVDVRSGRPIGQIREGIGQGPFSVVTAPSLRVGFVNNTASHDLSVLDLTTLQVLERVPTPEIPIVMAIHPDGRSLWVSSEGEDGVTVFEIPDSYRRAPPTPSPSGPPGTDIWVADLSNRNGWYELGEPTRVTDRDGYDNQPCLLPGGQLLYTSIDSAGQADIWLADLASGSSRPFTRTAPESEYSPQLMPDGRAVSVVRVEADSAQRLWRFPLDGSEPSVILEDVAPVGYYAWLDGERVAVFVLGDPPSLEIVNLHTGQAERVAERIGRSLQYVPSRRALSFVQLGEDGSAVVRARDVSTGVTAVLTSLRAGAQDLAWTADGVILMGEGSRLYQWTAAGGWRLVEDLAAYGVGGITRLSVSPEGGRLALVANR